MHPKPKIISQLKVPRLDQIENMQLHEELKSDQEIHTPFRNHSTSSIPKYFIHADPANMLSPHFGGADLGIEGAIEHDPELNDPHHSEEHN